MSCANPLAGVRQAAVAVFEEALEKMSTPHMYDLYAAFLTEQMDLAVAEASDSQKATKATRRRAGEAANALLKLASHAAAAGEPRLAVKPISEHPPNLREYHTPQHEAELLLETPTLMYTQTAS